MRANVVVGSGAVEVPARVAVRILAEAVGDGRRREDEAVPEPCWKAPSATSKCHSAPYFASQPSASRRRRASSVTRTASPSTTMSRPSWSVFVPVRRLHRGWWARFFAFCSSGPVLKQRRAVLPHGDGGRGVGAAVAADGRDPEQLGRLEVVAGLGPGGGGDAGVAVAGVEVGDRIDRAHVEFDRGGRRNSSPRPRVRGAEA